jgi:hypothetical protein
LTKLDKDLYRQAYEQYRQWNEAELAERRREKLIALARYHVRVLTLETWRQGTGKTPRRDLPCIQDDSLWQFIEELNEPELLTEYQRLLARVEAL